MNKEKMKQCHDCLKQIKIAKKFGQYSPKLLQVFLNEYDVTEADLKEYNDTLEKK